MRLNKIDLKEIILLYKLILMPVVFIFMLLSMFILNNFSAVAEWYNPDVACYRISTTKDGVACVNIKELLAIAPELEGEDASGLHLLFNGEKYPFYYKSSNTSTNKINRDDKIYFVGKRASGDTTYFEHYTNETVFFLYYNLEDNASRRLELFQEPTNTTDKITSAKFHKHFEKDIRYYFGYDVLNVNPDLFEKWYWKILGDYPGGRASLKLDSCLFTSHFNYNPANSAEKIKLLVNFSTTYTDPKPPKLYKRNIKTILNADTIHNLELEQLVDDYKIQIEINKNKLFLGANQISILNASADTANTEIGIDYYEIFSEEVLRAQNSEISFELENISQNSLVEVSGFSAPEVVIIDTIGKLILFKNGTGISQVSANIKKQDSENTNSNMISLSINGESHIYNHSGFHIGILRPDADASEFQSSKQMGKEIENLLPTISKNSIVTIAYNGENNIPIYLRNWLISQGAKKIQEVTSGVGYICVLKVGESESIKEITSSEVNLASGEVISLESEFEDIYNRAFSTKFNVYNTDKYFFVMADTLGIEKSDVLQTQKTNLRSNNYKADMVIISHPKFYNASLELAKYRKSQGYSIEVVSSEDVYKEFSFGKKTPHGIKSFLKYAYENWKLPKLKYVLLVGDASYDPKFNNPSTVAVDYVPSFGAPSSDYWYGLFSDDDIIGPELMVARLPAATEAEVLDYIEKIKVYESSMPAQWQKHFLFLNGGQTAEEQKRTRYDAAMFADIITSPPICAEDFHINKNDFVAAGEGQKKEIIAAINSGAMFTIFNGHASPEVFDMDGWQVQNLSNKDKYGILATLSCNSGAFAETPFVKCRNEEYVLAKDKGFIAAIGPTTFGEVTSGFAFFHKLLNLILDEKRNIRTIGDLINIAKQEMPHLGSYSTAVRYYYSLLGDPLLKIKIDTIPDLFLSENTISITNNRDNSDFIKETDDFVNIKTKLYNSGVTAYQKFNVKLSHTYNNNTSEYIESIDGLCATTNIDFKIPVLDKAGEHTIIIEIDPENNIFETRKDNNKLISKFYVYKTGLLAVEPLDYWNMPTENLRFRQINPLYGISTGFNYEFKILHIDNNTGDTIIIKSSNKGEIQEKENYVDWLPNITLLEQNSYILSSHLVDTTNNTKSNILNTNFNTYVPFSSNSTNYSLKTENEFSSIYKNNMMISKSKKSDFNLCLLDTNYTYQIKAFTNPNITPPRYCRIYIGDSVYVDGSAENRGFNVVIIPKDTTSPSGRYYRFDTTPWWEDNDVDKFLSFLKDSISTDEYVIISTSDRVITGFSKAQLDTLKILLNSYGSALVDNISEWSAFAMIGWKGATKGSIQEQMIDADTAKLSGQLTFYAKNGKSRTKLIGPATRWNNINIKGELSKHNSKSTVEIVGIDEHKQETVLVTTNSAGEVDISGIDADKYSYILLDVISSRDIIGGDKDYISEITVSYAPAAELTFCCNEKKNLNPVLRGDSSKLKLFIENISLRSDSKPGEVNIKIIGASSGTLLTNSITLPIIKKNSTEEIYSSIDTEFLDNKNLLTAIIDSINKNKELYVFNNFIEVPLVVYEDTLAPSMEIKIDGDIIVNKDYITDTPVIEATLFDNSKLAVTSAEPITLRINGEFQNKLNTQFYNLEHYPAGSELKAKLKIIPKALSDKENLFVFTCLDGSGNRDTSVYILKISLNGFINDLVAYPNPIVNLNTGLNFKFYFIAMNNEALADVEIFNLLGKKVKTISQPLKLRNNYILWDLRDENGELIPSGTYIYSINVRSDYWVEPVFGKFIFSR